MRAIDAAREYRQRNIEDLLRGSEPAQLAGLSAHPCERFVYLQLKEGESPRQQQKAVFAYWKELAKQQGPLAGMRGQRWLITMPNGDKYCDFCAVRFPSLVTETEAAIIPLVEKSFILLQEFAVATARRWGIIEHQSSFVSNDGRRLPLAECSYRALTGKDFTPTRHRKKKTPKPPGT